MASDRKLTGSVGEHFVCSVLAQLGWASSLTRDGLERTDILAVNVDSRQMLEVQVKTARANPRPSWQLGRKGTLPANSNREWYVLVLLAPEARQRPRAFVVPRDHVAAATWIAHMTWLTDPSATPGKRSAGIESARVSIEDWLSYEERWDLLDAPSSQSPVLLPGWMRAKAQNPTVGLPESHPWRGTLPVWG